MLTLTNPLATLHVDPCESSSDASCRLLRVLERHGHVTPASPRVTLHVDSCESRLTLVWQRVFSPGPPQTDSLKGLVGV